MRLGLGLPLAGRLSVSSKEFPSRITRPSFLALACCSSVLALSSAAEAACGAVSADVYLCDSGALPGGINDLAGDNTLTLPAGGTGSIGTGVTFGGGVDTIEMDSGTIDGPVNQGDGRDVLTISGGTINGAVNQGDGEDVFTMTGGTIGSLNQSGDLDEFYMHGGHIIGNFNAGDYGEMTGGRIGSVSLQGSSNTFLMSGGGIDGNLTATGGASAFDTIVISGDSAIGGDVRLNQGDDRLTLSGGSVGGSVLLGTGADTFSWSGGTIAGPVDMGEGDDNASLSGLDAALTGMPTAFLGGLGVDTLTLEDTQAGAVGRFGAWETMELTGASMLTVDAALTLGDAGTGTGTLTVGSGAAILGGGGAAGGVFAFDAGQLASVSNAGTLDLTNGGSGAGDVFTIAGNYAGLDGRLLLDTLLGDDASPSDRLVIDAGAASGTTSIGVVNDGGGGALTASNGILLVETQNGGTTGADAFALAGPVAAGAYEYRLFRGGFAAGSEENWYLRSTLNEPPSPPPGPPPATEPEPAPVAEGEIPLPGSGVAPPTPGATPAPMPPAAPIVRPEVPAYAALPPLGQMLGIATLGTFHQRRGDTDRLGKGTLPTSWGRLFGHTADDQWQGSANPAFDGHLIGLQAGQDLAGWEWENGQQTQFGVLAGYTRLDGDLSGTALGWNNLAVGSTALSATTIGVSLTHFSPQGWYVDAVALHGWLDGDVGTYRNTGIDVEGDTTLLSLEAGVAVPLGADWRLHPNGQIVWQRVSLDPADDGLSAVRFPDQQGWVGRLGLRIEGDATLMGTPFKPNLEANLRHRFDQEGAVRLGTDTITTDLSGTSLELAAGLSAELGANASLHAGIGYTFDVDGGRQRQFNGNLGVSVTW